MKFPKYNECIKCESSLIHDSEFSVEYRGPVYAYPHRIEEALVYACKCCGYKWTEPCADARADE